MADVENTSSDASSDEEPAQQDAGEAAQQEAGEAARQQCFFPQDDDEFARLKAQGAHDCLDAQVRARLGQPVMLLKLPDTNEDMKRRQEDWIGLTGIWKQTGGGFAPSWAEPDRALRRGEAHHCLDAKERAHRGEPEILLTEPDTLRNMIARHEALVRKERLDRVNAKLRDERRIELKKLRDEKDKVARAAAAAEEAEAKRKLEAEEAQRRFEWEKHKEQRSQTIAAMSSADLCKTLQFAIRNPDDRKHTQHYSDGSSGKEEFAKIIGKEEFEKIIEPLKAKNRLTEDNLRYRLLDVCKELRKCLEHAIEARTKMYEYQHWINRVGDWDAPEHEAYAKTYFAHQVADQQPCEPFANAETTRNDPWQRPFGEELLDEAEKREYDIVHGYFWMGGKLVNQLDMRHYQLPCSTRLPKGILNDILRFVDVPEHPQEFLKDPSFERKKYKENYGFRPEYKENYGFRPDCFCGDKRSPTFDKEAWRTVARLRKACLELKRAMLKMNEWLWKAWVQQLIVNEFCERSPTSARWIVLEHMMGDRGHLQVRELFQAAQRARLEAPPLPCEMFEALPLPSESEKPCYMLEKGKIVWKRPPVCMQRRILPNTALLGHEDEQTRRQRAIHKMLKSVAVVGGDPVEARSAPSASLDELPSPNAVKEDDGPKVGTEAQQEAPCVPSAAAASEPSAAASAPPASLDDELPESPSPNAVKDEDDGPEAGTEAQQEAPCVPSAAASEPSAAASEPVAAAASEPVADDELPGEEEEDDGPEAGTEAQQEAPHAPAAAKAKPAAKAAAKVLSGTEAARQSRKRKAEETPLEREARRKRDFITTRKRQLGKGQCTEKDVEDAKEEAKAATKLASEDKQRRRIEDCTPIVFTGDFRACILESLRAFILELLETTFKTGQNPGRDSKLQTLKTHKQQQEFGHL